MSRLYPKLEYHEIAGTGHFLMMEKPQEFNRLLTDFLTKVKFCRGGNRYGRGSIR